MYVDQPFNFRETSSSGKPMLAIGANMEFGDRYYTIVVLQALDAGNNISCPAKFVEGN